MKDIMEMRANINPYLPIRGHGKVELFNAETGELEFCVEKDNTFYPENMELCYWTSNDSNLRTTLVNLMKNITGGAYPNACTLDVKYRYAVSLRNMYTSLEADEWSGLQFLKNVVHTITPVDASNAYTNEKIGNLNGTETTADTVERKIRLVVDFPTNVGNGQFNSIGLCPEARMAYNDNTRLPTLMCNLEIYKDALGKARGFKNASFNMKGNLFSDLVADYLVTRNSGDYSMQASLYNPKTGETKVTPKLYTPAGANINTITTNGNAYAYLSSDKSKLFIMMGRSVGTNGWKMYVYDLTTMNYGATSVNAIAEYGGSGSSQFYTIGFNPGNVYNFAHITGTQFYCYVSSATVETTSGLAFNKLLLKVDLSNMSILGFIVNPLDWGVANGVSFPRNFGNASWNIHIRPNGNPVIAGEYTSINMAGYVVTLYSVIEYDLSEDQWTMPIASNYGQPYVFRDIEETLLLSSNFTQKDSAGLTRYLLAEVIPPVDSRIVLPAPVTKTNTQTMKLTYDLYYPPLFDWID